MTTLHWVRVINMMHILYNAYNSKASSNLRGLGEQELRYMRKSKEFEPRHPTRKIKAAKLSRRKHYKFVSEAPQYSSLTTESFYETRFKEMVITNLDGISNHILIFGTSSAIICTDI